MGGPTKRKGEPAGFRSREGCQPVWESRCLVVMKAMGNDLAQLDYWVYRLARLLSEYLNLGELVAVSTGSLEEEPLAPTQFSAC
jgi:hypothetical protein